ncbi:MAG: response regulator [Ardenticatenaceae bacterium]|nr:response regulator [Ardenticatenaceae bacterium]
MVVDLARPTLLVVDDDPAILGLVASLLEDQFDVACASDGWEALVIAAEVQPDVVLLDLMMPGINGLTLTEELRKLPRGRDLPVFVMTAHRGLQAEAERLGVAGCFLKPFEPDVLITGLASATKV